MRAVTLADKYDLQASPVFVTGVQALVRLCLLQREKDQQAGLDTAGYVSGYRGSPVGGIDLQFSQAKPVLDQAGIIFHPALNEDLAATAIWGTQQANLHNEGTKDGVFAIWYGKGPGVDRTGDVFRHANLAGTSEHGGVLVLMGDDHLGESSTVCHQSEFAMIDAMIPILNPANLEEMVDFGLHGWALSRFAGVWCGIKCVKDNIESTASVRLPANRSADHLPAEFNLPEGGLNIRRGDDRHRQEQRLHEHKLQAVKAYVKANRLDRVMVAGGAQPKFGIVSTGKAYMDVLQALADLGIDHDRAASLGVSVYKVGMPWPVEPTGIETFSVGLERILVVEEKRAIIEPQIKEILYGGSENPLIIGKFDQEGHRLLREEGAINAMNLALVIASNLLPKSVLDPELIIKKAHVEAIVNREITALSMARNPYFCAGCPHNSSTVLPEGARGYAGIGCHWMAQFMDRNVEGNTHMGGEGANWIGEACFSHRKHVFQNIGDGTFNHSGLMAIRAAVAAKVNMTYKVLYNDAVAMTGGQSHEGDMTAAEIAQLLTASGVQPLMLVTDDLSRHDRSRYPATMRFYHRSELQSVQQQLSTFEGVSGLIYEQTCAAEKRRRRKRGLMPDPDERIFINAEVCEGCGDCGVQSNCVAILPLETDLGRKRQIDQSACNKDFSCIQGFCPSFVTVKGGSLRKPDGLSPDGLSMKDTPLPIPVACFDLTRPVSIVLTGIGGTGVVTIGALLGMAAHLEGRGCGIIDMAGLAQKGGAVTSHIRIARRAEDISAIRIGPGGADLLLGCDGLVSADADLLKLISKNGHVVANSYEMPTGEFTHNSEARLPVKDIAERLSKIVPEGQSSLVNATELAVSLLGDAIAANLFLLGVAWQRGLIPLSAEAIEQAITLNNIAVQRGRDAFYLGRQWVVNPEKVQELATTSRPMPPKPLDNLEDIIADRTRRLIAYQNKAYAHSYHQQITAFSQIDNQKDKKLTKAVARYLFKMMAIKDEYEVARLYTDGQFARQIRATFKGDVNLSLHLAPPIFASFDRATGRPKKSVYGRWIWPILHVLKHLRVIRGSAIDIFGYSRERQEEQKALADYLALLEKIRQGLCQANYDIGVELASIPEYIRGFGPVRRAHRSKAEEKMRQTYTHFESAFDPDKPQ